MTDYDHWKTTDAAAERAEQDAEFIAEHSTYEMSCCGYPMEADALDFGADGRPEARCCPNEDCNIEEGAELQAVPRRVTVIEPDVPTRADYAPDRYED